MGRIAAPGLGGCRCRLGDPYRIFPVLEGDIAGVSLEDGFSPWGSGFRVRSLGLFSPVLLDCLEKSGLKEHEIDQFAAQ